MNFKLTHKQAMTILFVGFTAFVSGCKSTEVNQHTERSHINNSESKNIRNALTATPQRNNIARLDEHCYSQVLEREKSVGKSTDLAQQIALAKAATRCIENKSFYPKHPDNQMAMQLNALAVVNYIKAGETEMAQHSLASFRATFVQQDLLFADYTSFVDTAIALLEYEALSAHQLQTLNINSTLRNELKRQQYWRNN
jgi:hypothetical protein